MIETESETIAFVLHLRPGAAEEYRRRHAEIWPELLELQCAAGIMRYEIYLHAPTNLLFAHIKRRSNHSMNDFPKSDVWLRWQQHMSDLLEQSGGIPVRDPLVCVFNMYHSAAQPENLLCSISSSTGTEQKNTP